MADNTAPDQDIPDEELRDYTVTLTFNFEAASMADAAQQFRERLIEGGFTVQVHDDVTGEMDDL